jgi:hypothetical protein
LITPEASISNRLDTTPNLRGLAVFLAL